jgi:primase-polymerase (primpol)-like protein
VKDTHIYTPHLTGPYPESLTNQPHWSLMKLDWSDDRQKFLKIPIDIETGYAANSDDICVPFERALRHLRPNTVASYRQPNGSKTRLGLIDCDNCIAADGSISTRIQKLLKAMDAYAEYSVTGTGIHILCWLADVPPAGHKDAAWDMEFYWERQRNSPTRTLPRAFAHHLRQPCRKHTLYRKRLAPRHTGVQNSSTSLKM